MASPLGASIALACVAGCADVKEWLSFGDAEVPTATLVAPTPARTGTLLLSGGGRVAGAVVAEAARLVSGTDVRVLVVPLTSASPDAGQLAADTWRKAGFPSVEVLDAHDSARAAAQMDSATFVWMTGGNEARVLGKLLDTTLAEGIRRRFEAGAIVGGTNVAAAAVSEVMLTGAGADDEMVQGRIETAGGLGLWPGVIVDQHFVAKKRFNRLMAAVLDHPQLVGVGIDEGTGVVVTGSAMRVVGDGNVVILDARHARLNPSRPGDPSAAVGVEMQLLAAGMSYELKR